MRQKEAYERARAALLRQANRVLWQAGAIPEACYRRAAEKLGKERFIQKDVVE